MRYEQIVHLVDVLTNVRESLIAYSLRRMAGRHVWMSVPSDLACPLLACRPFPRGRPSFASSSSTSDLSDFKRADFAVFGSQGLSWARTSPLGFAALWTFTYRLPRWYASNCWLVRIVFAGMDQVLSPDLTSGMITGPF